MTTTTLTPAPAWSVAGAFLDAFTSRSFDQLATLVAPDVRFRCLLPRGPVELIGSDQLVDRFHTWFGGEDRFEVLDASVGQIGSKTYLRWRVRMQDATGATRVAEQHLFVTGDPVLQTLDLLCSGFQAETGSAS